MAIRAFLSSVCSPQMGIGWTLGSHTENIYKQPKCKRLEHPADAGRHPLNITLCTCIYGSLFYFYPIWKEAWNHKSVHVGYRTVKCVAIFYEIILYESVGIGSYVRLSYFNRDWSKPCWIVKMCNRLCMWLEACLTRTHWDVDHVDHEAKLGLVFLYFCFAHFLFCI